MSDNDAKKPAGGTGTWTEEEKIGLLFSIIETSGVKMDWSSIRLPPGRTVKACSVWLDKQRAARKKLRAEAGEDGEEVAAPPKTPKTPAKSRKRVAKDVPGGEGDDEEATPKAKKPKTPRKKEAAAKVQAGADAEAEADAGAEGDARSGEEMVKAEVEDELMT